MILLARCVRAGINNHGNDFASSCTGSSENTLSAFTFQLDTSSTVRTCAVVGIVIKGDEMCSSFYTATIVKAAGTVCVIGERVVMCKLADSAE